MSGGVFLIGLGLGPGDLGPRAAKALERAQVLAGGRRLLDLLADHPGQRIVLKGDLASWLDRVAEAAGEGRVAVLASGDPLFFGIGRRLLERLGPDRVEVFPNITSIQAGFAALKEPWDGVEIVSLHGRDGQGLWAALARAERVALLTDPSNTPAALARELLDRGQAGWRMSVLEDLGQADQRIGEYSLEAAASVEFSPLNVVVLRRTAPRPGFFLGQAEEAYEHQAGLITKAEVRAVALGLLGLGPGMCVWDLGAGCGSVGLEASLLIPGGRIVALEKDPARVELIKANQAHYQVGSLEVVRGEMPGALADLPDPDRVFIGGGGRDLEKIVHTAASRLAPGGVVVVSLVLLESLETALAALARAGLETDWTQVQIGRSAPLAGGTRLQALNPVWLVRGRKRKEP